MCSSERLSSCCWFMSWCIFSHLQSSGFLSRRSRMMEILSMRIDQPTTVQYSYLLCLSHYYVTVFRIQWEHQEWHQEWWHLPLSQSQPIRLMNWLAPPLFASSKRWRWWRLSLDSRLPTSKLFFLSSTCWEGPHNFTLSVCHAREVGGSISKHIFSFVNFVFRKFVLEVPSSTPRHSPLNLFDFVLHWYGENQWRQNLQNSWSLLHNDVLVRPL